MVNTDIDSILSQCKSSDVDIKIAAVAQLQQFCETHTAISHVDDITNSLKACLRISNQYLTAATLSVLPPFFSLVFPFSDQARLPLETSLLRQLLSTFLSAGGIIDRLGDSRERSREKARESLVILGGLAYQRSAGSQSSIRAKDAGKASESPISIFEGHFRENALQSKVWRVREQAILTLVDIRRRYMNFPLRPYLSHLVDALEDTDGTVRECAKQSIVDLFRGPSVSDAARADLKKEMSKKGVRKAIVDSVLQKLFAAPLSGTPHDEMSDNGEGVKKEYLPPSLSLMNRKPTANLTGSGGRTVSQNSLADSVSRPSSRMAGEPPPSTPTEIEIEVVYIYVLKVASGKELEQEFAQMLKYFEGKETEHNWAAREKSIVRIRGMLKGDIYTRYPDTFVNCLKAGVLDGTVKTLNSLRTTLAAHTCALYSELATTLGLAIDPFYEMLFVNLIRLSGSTKKIMAVQSQTVMDTIIIRAPAHPKITIHNLCSCLQEKNVQTRTYALAHLKVYLETHGKSSKQAIESLGYSELLEKAVKKGLGDASPAPREAARVLFWVLESVWPERGASIINTLDVTARRQLEKICPDPESRKLVPMPETPRPKKSSVAAAIAASRTKAKAIASDPPTLRHQATSTSHAIHMAVSAPRQRPASPALSSKSVPGARQSPPTPRSLSSASPSRRSLGSSVRHTSSLESSNTLSAIAHQRSLSAGSPPSALKDTSRKRLISTQAQNGSSMVSKPSMSNLGRSVSSTLIQRKQLHNGLPSSKSPSVNYRSSTLGLESFEGDESLLMAATIPVPEDSDSDRDSNMLSSFSAAFDAHPSHVETQYSNGTSSVPNTMLPVVEDALRARAEQAESAAERLLELVEPDVDSQISPIPHVLLPSSGLTSVTKLPALRTLPTTPINKKSHILRQAALFQNSPAYKGSSLMDVLNDRKHENSWWMKRMALIREASNSQREYNEKNGLETTIQYVSDIANGVADVKSLKNIAVFCHNNPIRDLEDQSVSFPNTPSFISEKNISAKSNIWMKDIRLFNRLFNVLVQYMDYGKPEEILEYALIVVWEMMENQASLLEGREGDLFALLLSIRYCNKIKVLEATNTLRDAMVDRTEAVYGLTTLHSCLRAFESEPLPSDMLAEWKSTSYAFGLIGLGKFILRLPAEVLEEELPRLKDLLISSLNDANSLIVRESAATVMIASQLVLRDESQLFVLLDGLSDEKKNLLTYLFDKHGARQHSGMNDITSTDKLEKEMRRLDSRVNTPPRTKDQS